MFLTSLDIFVIAQVQCFPNSFWDTLVLVDSNSALYEKFPDMVTLGSSRLSEFSLECGPYCRTCQSL